MIINNNSDFLNKLETLVNENKIVNFFDKTMNMFKIINSQPKKMKNKKRMLIILFNKIKNIRIKKKKRKIKILMKII